MKITGFDPAAIVTGLLSYLRLRVAAVSLGPLDASILVLATLGALLSLTGLWRISRREDRERRFAALYADSMRRSETARPPRRGLYRRLGTTLGTALATSRLITVAEQRKLIAELAAAGLKGQEHVAAFIAAKFFAGLAFVGFSWLYLDYLHLFTTIPLARVVLMSAGFLLGWRAPDLVLLRLAARRRLLLEQGFPDALDLLVVCVEVGLSLDQAIEEVARQMASSAREVAYEFGATAAEMRVSSDRAQALENLVQRTDVKSLHSLIATLVQSVRFGTPLAESLRLIASELRAERAAKIEERTARLPTLLMIPLMAFIFPALMFVIGTPILIRILDTLRNISWHSL